MVRLIGGYKQKWLIYKIIFLENNIILLSLINL